MKELTNEQAETLYNMYLRGLISFSEFVDYIYNSIMYSWSNLRGIIDLNFN